MTLFLGKAKALAISFAAMQRRGCVCAAMILLVAPVQVGQAQNGPDRTVTGTVRLRGPDTPIAGVTVFVDGAAHIATTDSLGRFTLRDVPAGPQIIVARRLGYALTRTPITVPVSGAMSVDLLMATSALRLDQVTVTGDRSGRARGELGTATVLDRDAIANQIASSLQGVLELVPGVPIQAPGLDASAQFSLRNIGQVAEISAGATYGPGASSIGASGTLIILDGIPLSNNANLQTVGARGETVPRASTAGGGIDLRRIPAATLERVEVIRGIPSARWGDLTQGAIVVDTRAAAAAPEFAGKYDSRTTEGNVVGGKAFQDDRQSLTITGNIAQTASLRTLENYTTTRGAGQLAHRLQFGSAPANAAVTGTRTSAPRLSFDTRLDWYQLKFAAPERADGQAGRSSFQADHGIRLGERARMPLALGVLEWTAAYDAQSQSTRETRLIGRPTSPFTDRLTEGRNIGSYVEGLYNGAYELLGAPRFLYSRLEWDRRSASGSGQLSLGTEVRREWNVGRGYQFAIDKPPQTSPFNGTAGFDRPRGFDTVPGIATSALYADSRFYIRRGQMFLEVQPGLRLETLHESDSWTSGVRSAQLQPRLNVQLSPRSWLRLRGGLGTVSKSPTVSQLHPAQQFYDLVNVNRFTINPAERLAVITTFIRNPVNPDLGLSRASKREAGFELDGGARRGVLNVTWFDDRIRGAVTLRRDPSMLQRARYALADTGTGSGKPGHIVEPPILLEPVPIFLDRYVNGGRLDSRGVEYVATLPIIPVLRTRVELSGATIETAFATDDRDYGITTLLSNFSQDTSVKRVAYAAGVRSRERQSIRTWRLVHQQPDVGLVITLTMQQRLAYRRKVEIATDPLRFEGYIDRAGNLVPVPLAERSAPQYADLRAQRASANNSTFTIPSDWLMSLQIAKSIGRNGRMSFYVFNLTDNFATFNSVALLRRLPSSRFGAELTLPTSEFFGAGR
jgi:hypothetical protein